jgi:hypothetical protein
MRLFRWELFLFATIIVIGALAVLAIFAPAMPGTWCSGNEVWRVCYREWLTALSGWMALVAALIALALQRAI